MKTVIKHTASGLIGSALVCIILFGMMHLPTQVALSLILLVGAAAVRAMFT